jgi:hypothetical protein
VLIGLLQYRLVAHVVLPWSSGSCQRAYRSVEHNSASERLRPALPGARQLRSAVGVRQRAPRTDPFAHNRIVDHPGKILVGRVQVAVHLPDGVSRYVDDGFAGTLGQLRLVTYSFS